MVASSNNNDIQVIGSSKRVVDFGGLTIDELVGNVATAEDTLSVAKVTISQPTSEPWLTLEYDEWICVLQGRIEMNVSDKYGAVSVVHVKAGETVFVPKGKRFRPVFPQADTVYIPICLPAFKPERCHREDKSGTSEIAENLKKLHAGATKQKDAPVNAPTSTTTTSTTTTAVRDKEDRLFHMCRVEAWEAALQAHTAYFPPTFVDDGHFTHATAVASRLLTTANHFESYRTSRGDWICVELSQSNLAKLGIVTRFEEPKPVGEQGTAQEWDTWRCPHIFGGIPGFVPGVVTNVYPMERDAKGTFLAIKGM